jgi:hypothetical protein
MTLIGGGWREREREGIRLRPALPHFGRMVVVPSTTDASSACDPKERRPAKWDFAASRWRSATTGRFVAGPSPQASTDTRPPADTPELIPAAPCQNPEDTGRDYESRWSSIRSLTEGYELDRVVSALLDSEWDAGVALDLLREALETP